MGSVQLMPVRLKYDICRQRNGGCEIMEPADRVKCPRVGECLCVPRRAQLVAAVKRAQDALDAYDGTEMRNRS